MPAIRSCPAQVAGTEFQFFAACLGDGSFPITFTRWVEPAGEGTRVQAIIEGDASGFFRIAAPILRWLVNRSIQADYRRLKQLLDEG